MNSGSRATTGVHLRPSRSPVRVARHPGGKIGLLSWTPEGFVGGLFRTMGPFAPTPPPCAQPPPPWGSEDHLKKLSGDRVEFATLERQTLEVTAFERPLDFAEHFKQRYGPTITTLANARRNGREEELNEALNAFFKASNRGTEEETRFEMEYLLAVGTQN